MSRYMPKTYSIIPWTKRLKWTDSFLKFLHCIVMIFVYWAFFCLQLETNLSVSCLETLNAFHVIASFLSFLSICSNNSIIIIYCKKSHDYSHLQKCYITDGYPINLPPQQIPHHKTCHHWESCGHLWWCKA